MMPTFDFVNVVKQACKYGLKIYGTKTGRLATFAASVSAIVAYFTPESLVSSFLPQIPSVSSLINISSVNQDLFNLLGYTCAADVAVKGLQNFFSFINWIVETFIYSVISLVVVIFGMCVWSSGYQDLKDLSS